jgi:hypothetical protein
MVHYLGYKCPWEKYPISKFLNGDEHDVTLIDTSGELGLTIAASKRSQYLLGRAVHPENVPTVMQWTSRPAPTDFDTPGGFPCISPKIKSIIEQFEPDVHQFFPLKVVNKVGDEIAQRWLWVVCNRIDSVDREHTNLFFRHGSLWTPEYFEDGKRIKVEGPRVVFNKSQSFGKHFWRDQFLGSNPLICSDEAGAVLNGANLTALKLTHKETI